MNLNKYEEYQAKFKEQAKLSKLDKALMEVKRYNAASLFKVSPVAYIVRKSIPLMKKPLVNIGELK